MSKKLRVLFVSPEASPFAKAGGLGDAVQSLSAALAAEGAEVSLVLPKYRRPEIAALAAEPCLSELSVPLGAEKVKASVSKTVIGIHNGQFSGLLSAAEALPSPLTIDLFLIDNPKYFCRDEIYGSPNEEYLDNDARFAFFSRATLEFVLKAKLHVDVIHCHDWPTALIPLFMKTHYARKRHFKETATVFSLHDAARQGKFPPESLALTGLNWDYFTPDQLALNGRFNFLKAGLIFSDVVHAALPASSFEPPPGDARLSLSRTRQGGNGEGDPLKAGEPVPAAAPLERIDRARLPYSFSNGLETILEKRPDVFTMISNGADSETWKSAARRTLQLYAQALDIKRGGLCGR